MNGKVPPIIIIFIGLIFYMGCGFFSLYISFANYLKMLAVIVVLCAFYKSIKTFAFDTSNTLIKLFFYYTIFILIRGTLLVQPPVDSGAELTSFYDIIRYFLVQEHSAMAFVLILMLAIPFDYRELRYYRALAIICAIICLINVYLYKDELFSFDTFGQTHLIDSNGKVITIRVLANYCFVGMGIVLLFSYGFSILKQSWIDYFVLSVIIFYGVVQVAGGGRGGFVTALLYIMFLLYFIMKNRENKRGLKVIGIIINIAIVCFVVYGAYYMLFVSNFAEFLFSRLFVNGDIGEGMNESTREGFVEALNVDLNEHPLAWLFGKGVNGSYHVNSGRLRETIEWGYWYLILKGGIIYLILYVSVLLRSFYFGFFKSNNLLSKAMAVLCFMCAYSLIPFGLPRVSLDYVLVWHYVRLINTSTIRNMTDQEMYNLISSKVYKMSIKS